MSIYKFTLPLAETGQFSRIIQDYINGADQLQPFYKFPPERKSFRLLLDTMEEFKGDRNLLSEVITSQYQLSGINKDLSQLRDKNTFTVCTGHQLCLFTGPLYFIYKIISTIRLAEELKKDFPDKHFIPVYWMATEDHDFEEISSINLFGKTLTWENPGKNGPVGRLPTSSLEKVIGELSSILGSSENAEKLIALFKKAYLGQVNLANATRVLVDELFGSYGLVIVNGDDQRLKSTFTKVISDDILNNTNSRLVTESIKLLEAAGYKSQVNPRLINSFYMSDTSRDRIDLDSASGKYKVLNTEIAFSKEEIISELENNPEKFSTNVVLRPLYQQAILPNLAYVGGPGEIAYWLEYKAMFEHHKVLFPVLIPRSFIMLLDEKQMKQLNDLGLSIEDLFKETDLLVRKFVEANAGGEISLNSLEDKLSGIFAMITEKASVTDQSLVASVEAEHKKAIQAIKNIENKMLRSEKQKQETSVTQIKKLKEKLFPAGGLQERYDNFAPYYLKMGDELIPFLHKNIDPFQKEMIILELK